MTGIELRLMRTAARVMAKDVAEAAGWSQSRISQIEARDRVTPGTAERYVAALATCSTKTTETDAAPAA